MMFSKMCCSLKAVVPTLMALQDPPFKCIYVELNAFSISAFKLDFFISTGMGCLITTIRQKNTLLDLEMMNDLTYFFFKKNSFPSNFGKRGMTRSSAKNMPYAAQSFLFASKGLYLSRNFEMPITLIAAKC